MKRKSSRLVVDPLFHKKIKIEAAKQGRSIYDLTRELAHKDDFHPFPEKDKGKGKRKDIDGWYF